MQGYAQRELRLAAPCSTQIISTQPLCFSYCSGGVCAVAETSASWSAFLRITGNTVSNGPVRETGVDG